MKPVMKKARKVAAGVGFSVVTLAAVAATTVATSSVAHAGATGCQFTKGFNVSVKGQNLAIPGGNLCHQIQGDKKKITKQSASFNSYVGKPGFTCNWRIDFIYKKVGGKIYKRDKGPTKNNCQWNVSRTVHKDKNLAHYGKSCAQLWVNGKRKVTQCHNITAGFKLW